MSAEGEAAIAAALEEYQAKCEWKVFKLVNEKGKFGIGVDYRFPTDDEYYAFERGMEKEWYRLIDVAHHAVAPVLVRFFLLTPLGRLHYADLCKRFNKESKLLP